MTASRKIFIFAGELSGDLHGANLLRALKSQVNDLTVNGVCGPELRSCGVSGPLQMEDFMVMGFSDVIKSLPRLLWQFHKIRNHILKTDPNIAIFIDSPSFSIPMAKSLRKAGFKGKIVQYICPTVWAWGKNRIQKMANFFDLLLTIYPFEAPYFSKTPLNVQYVGNPLQEAIKSHIYDPEWKQKLGIDFSRDIVALFPGSRPGEVFRNLPPQLEAAKIFLKYHPKTVFGISYAHENILKIIHLIVEKFDLKENRDVVFIPKKDSYDLMKSARSAIAKSGTVTLELALHRCPTVVTYKLSLFNKWIAQHILKVNLPHYCIVNILERKTIFPELITEECSSEAILKELLPLHQQGPVRDQCRSQCQEIQDLLFENDSSIRAAHEILKIC